MVIILNNGRFESTSGGRPNFDDSIINNFDISRTSCKENKWARCHSVSYKNIEKAVVAALNIAEYCKDSDIDASIILCGLFLGLHEFYNKELFKCNEKKELLKKFHDIIHNSDTEAEGLISTIVNKNDLVSKKNAAVSFISKCNSIYSNLRVGCQSWNASVRECYDPYSFDYNGEKNEVILDDEHDEIVLSYIYTFVHNISKEYGYDAGLYMPPAFEVKSLKDNENKIIVASSFQPVNVRYFGGRHKIGKKEIKYSFYNYFTDKIENIK